MRACANCGTSFRVYPSMTKRYCSYECHLATGGAQRAGWASVQAVKKYGAKKDANHKELMTELRKHCAVYDMSDFGCGCPDGVAWIANNTWQFFDIKNPKTAYGKRGLNAVQRKWLGQHKGGPIYLLYTVEDAFRFALGQLDGLKFESGDSLYLNA